jgi:hypothetical protein
MKILFHTCVILVSAVLGLGVGFGWKAHRARMIIVDRASIQEPVIGDVGQVGIARKQRRDDSPLATELEVGLSASRGAERWLCWMAALEKAQPSDFPRLLRLTRQNPAAWHFVVNRWIQMAPRHLFDTLVTVSKYGGDLPILELGRELFDQWPSKDPDVAIAALTESSDLGRRDLWRVQVASAVMQKNPEQGLALLGQWHIESYSPRMDAVDAWAAANPQHAAEFTLAHPAGFASQSAMAAIGSVWAKTDPAAALSFATSQTGVLASKLATTVLKEWADRNLNDAADWLAGADQGTRNRLSPAFIETWARQDPNAALSWCDENLQGPQLDQAVAGVMKGAAGKDVVAAAAMVASMVPGSVRSAAAAAVAEQWFPNQILSGEKVKPEAISWLTSLDNDSIKRVLDGVTWGWANSDPQSLARFLSQAPADQVPSYTDSALARQMARSSPQDALAWAATLREGRGIAAGAEAFASWHSSQPEAAAAWLADLPAEDSRRQRFFESMVRSIAYAYGPQTPDQLSAMSPTDQAAAQAVIAKMSLPEDERARLLAAFKAH